MKILFIDRSTGVKSVNELNERPRGGTVNSLFKVTDHLSRKGHSVDVMSDISKPGTSTYQTRWIDDLDDDTYDALVCNRGIGDGYPIIKAKKRILWTHDLPHNGFIPQPKTMSLFHTVFMSKYSRDQWRYFYKTIDNYTVIPNGVDVPYKYKNLKRLLPFKNLRRVIFFSHPNRGLKRLPLIADAVNSKLKERVDFDAYTSKSMYPNENKFLEIEEFSQDYESQRNFRIHNPLKEGDLFHEVGHAGLMVMPTSIPETCSNSVLQSLALGTPVITTGNMGSVPEWVKHRKNGMLTKYLPNDYMVYTVEMVRNIIEVLSNPEMHAKMILNSGNKKILSWYEVGDRWEKLLTR